MNKPLIVIGAVWMVTAVAFAYWRIRSAGTEAMPMWLRALFTAAIGTLLWGVAIVARNAPPTATGGLTQLFSVAVYIFGCGAGFVIWHRDIFDLVAKPITSAFDGGTQAIVAKPFYSRALAYRKRGEPESALEEIQAQLQRFPGDLEGWLLWVDIQAEDLREPEAAINTIRTFLARDGVSAEDRLVGLQREADLLLFKLQDRAAARVVLENLVAEFPNSEASRLAGQRLSHMPGAEHLATTQSRERKPIAVVHHEERLGLTDDLGAAQAAASAAEDRDAEIRQLTLSLVDHPDDWERRERLAKLYLEHLDRPDLAQDQLERLVVTPGQPDRQVVRWLNQIADLHLADPDGLQAARLALERIGSRFPGSAAAEMAEQRLSHLSLEQRGQKETPKLKLGQYADRLGLTGRGPLKPLRARLPDLAPDPEADARDAAREAKDAKDPKDAKAV